MNRKQTLTLRKNKEEKNYNLVELLKAIFSERKDKNGRIIPASLSIKRKKYLIGLEEKKCIDSQYDDLLSIVEISDSKFKVVAEISILVIDRKNKMNNTLRLSLLDFCILTVSRCSILKTQNKDNIYKDLLENKYLSQLTNEVSCKYDKRIKGLQVVREKRKTVEDNKSNIESNTIEKHQKDKSDLESQRDNVISIGAIYGLFNNIVNHKNIIDYFVEHFYSYNSVDEVEVSLYIIQNRNKSDIKKTLWFYKQQSINKNKEIINIQQQIKEKSQECSRLRENIKKTDENLNNLNTKNGELRSEIQDLKEHISELGQDEKAKRVHLHDDADRAKSKAVNLLAEDVLEPIKLCLSALIRDRPKIEVASHHLEIIEEKVEKGLKWFKK